MSFASETKNELSRTMPEKRCCMLNPAVARHYKKMFKEYFSVDTVTSIGEGSGILRGKKYKISIGPEQLSEQILRETGILMVRQGMNYITDGVYDGIIKTKCCRKAYLRGAFLGAGTMTNPPPTPKRPVRNPTRAPASVAQGRQARQSTVPDAPRQAPTAGVDCRSMRTATTTMSAANASISQWLGRSLPTALPPKAAGSPASPKTRATRQRTSPARIRVSRPVADEAPTTTREAGIAAVSGRPTP